jgi:ABC-type sugar transport system ATPase subunit
VASEGEVLFDGKDVTDQLPHDRDVEMVFQNYALFPHLNVYSNIAFGMRLRKVPRAEIEARVKKVAQTLGIADVLERRPRELAGGQRRRVALGRAIVREPGVFLVDEPLSNLDAALRMDMCAEIIKLQDRLAVTTFYVTDDQVEALSMGDRIVVMRSGLIQQVGTPTELYEQPANAYVAGFIGSPPMNFLAGELSGEAIALAGGEPPLVLDEAHRRAAGRASGRDILVGIRPEHIQLSDRAASDGVYSLHGRIDTIEPLGHATLVRAELLSTDVLNVLASGKLPWSMGDPIYATFRPEHIYLFDRKSEETLSGVAM